MAEEVVDGICATCGGPVRMHYADEGTNWMEPADPHREQVESDLREAHAYIGRIILFVAQHGLADEWQAECDRYRARDAAERAVNPQKVPDETSKQGGPDVR